MGVKYVFVTGGVVSGLGKGITASSLGRLLKERGYRVTSQKIDPYINVDSGIMSPLQHGEVYVTNDGAEGDLDLGHYERFIDENLTVNSIITAGKVYYSVLQKERGGDYGGGTVQVIPHITNEIKERIYSLGQSDNADIVITEIGGTVGDIEGLPFIEAIRQIASEVGHENVVFVHVTLVPFIWGSNELKSKPTQHSVKELLSQGVQPDIIVCRSDMALPSEMRDKIALFCNIRREDVIQNLTVSYLYEVPLMLEKEGLANTVCHHLSLENRCPDLSVWRAMVERQKKATKKVTIGIVGKYVELHDAYISLAEALAHGGIVSDTKVDIRWINTEDVLKGDVKVLLSECDGIVIQGSFNEENCEGYIKAIEFVRLQKIPFLGICLGMQAAVIEFARNVLALAKANSTEYNPATPNPIVYSSSENNNFTDKSYTRLGIYPIRLVEDSRCRKIYGENKISERYRTRYEINTDYSARLEEAGMKIVGTSPDKKLIEAIEIPNHPWFVGVQYNAELRSRPNRPHPLIQAFIKAALNRS